MDSYVFLLNKHLTELIEQAQKKKLEEKVVEYRKRRSTLISANPNTPLEPITPKFLANPKVVISSVDGESIADAIGVYFSGIRILLLNVEGEEDKVFFLHLILLLGFFICFCLAENCFNIRPKCLNAF